MISDGPIRSADAPIAGWPMTAPLIRPMTSADVDAATALVLRGEFGDRRTFFQFALDHPDADPLVGVAGTEIVATGVGTRNGPAGWVGAIFVAPERRREGLGRAISEAVCEHLEARGARTLVLMASMAGRPVYEKLGFRVATRYHVVEAAGTQGNDVGMDAVARPEDGSVRPFDPARDLEAAIELDRSATGEDRASLLRRFASTPGSLADRTAEGLAGFLVRPTWHGAAIVATTPASALRLLDARRRATPPDHRIRAGLMTENEAGRAAFDAAGWTTAWTGTRMERGPALRMRPDWLFGQFGGAIG